MAPSIPLAGYYSAAWGLRKHPEIEPDRNAFGRFQGSNSVGRGNPDYCGYGGRLSLQLLRPSQESALIMAPVFGTFQYPGSGHLPA